ncbi:MAG: hypothetical protein R8G33_00105 [Gammaproteobacteria bacterium]|nr:hypothetical protein [Gammaproteobacteria bacterium]
MTQSILKLCALIILLNFSITNAETLYVGEGEKYGSIDEVQSVVSDGDIIEIVPGVYRDCAYFGSDNIVVRPKGWPKKKEKVRFQDVACEGKAIFVIAGDNALIEGIEFVNARVPDKNGAGIRFEGANLTINDSYFLNNEMGLLASENRDSEIVIRRSVFELNGKEPPRWGHGVYDDGAKMLRIIDSLFIKQKTGHHIKTRAYNAEILGNEISDGMDGNASYSVDFANGGNILIENNIIQKGPLSDNTTTAICIGCEGGRNESQSIIVRNNEFTNNTAKRVVFLRNLTSTKEELENNAFKGGKTTLVEHDYPE